MPRILRRYPYAQLVLVLSLVLLLLSFPVEQNRLVRTSLSSSLPSATGTSFAEATNAARPDHSQIVPPASTKQSTPAGLTNSSTKAKEAYGVLPLSFEANSGQTSRKVKFLARGQGYGLFLTSTGAVLSLKKSSSKQATKRHSVGEEQEARPTDEGAVLSMELVGSRREPRTAGIDELPGKTNYFVGNDPSQWRKGISTYAKVRYSGVYPGIDVIYYGNQRQLEYDFVIAPGKDPQRIKLAFDGTSGLRVDQSGNLVLTTSAGEIQQAKPFAYQMIDGVRHEVAANYRVEKQSVSFAVGGYDKSRELIIDPVVVYSSFLGGGSLDQGRAIAVDSQGSIYLTGITSSQNFPVANPIGTWSFPSDGFVSKLNPSGTALVYSTYLGGNGGDVSRAIALDSQGNAYVAGVTDSENFPTTAGALQVAKDTWQDGFVTKLSPSGSLIYSTFLGGDNGDSIFGLAVDTDGRAVVTGVTDSTRFSTNTFPTPRSGSATYKSIDKADHWSASSSGLTASTVNSFAIDPSNPNTVYAGTNKGVFKSTDGGTTWNLTGTASPSTIPLFTNVVIVEHEHPSIIYAATDFGIYKSTDGGTLFTVQNAGLDLSNMTPALAMDPTDATVLYAGTFSGPYKSVNVGHTWFPVMNGIGNEPVNEVVIDPSNPSIVYLGTFDGMFKSTNGGANWVNVNSGPLLNFLPEVSALAIDPLHPLTLYAAASNTIDNIVKTTDGGATWVGSGTGITYTIEGSPNPVLITALAIDPVTPTTLYAASQGAGIFKSTNAGASWSPSNTGLPDVVNSVIVDRNNPSTLFAGSRIPLDGFAAKLNVSGSALDYLVHFGGDQDDVPNAITLDTDGNAYLAGSTNSQNFPVLNAFQPVKANSLTDAFVAKLNSSGSFVYSTFLGGDGPDAAYAVAVRAGSAYVVGQTFSTNFPVANALNSTQNSSIDAFVTKLNPTGSALIFSTYLGGNNVDKALGVALDSAGGVFVTGSTSSSNFPVVGGPQSTYGGSTTDAFVTELNAAGASLVYSTYLGGVANEQGNGIAVDAAGNTYVVGTTSSNNFPTANAFQATRSGSNDAFFTKLGVPSAATTINLSQSYSVVNESSPGAQIIVNRNGDLSGASSIDYTTADSSGLNNCNYQGSEASSRCDYETTIGTLRFGAGESSKTITVPIVDDAYHEGNETFTINLSNPVGATLNPLSSATIAINDNDPVNGPNPIDQANFFVRQHYIDFLNREPDAGGLAFWSNQITECQQPGATCNATVRRINVSAAFFLSIEFQETGYLVERLYKTAYGDASGTSNFGPIHQLAVPIVRLNEFLPDTQEIGRGLIVGQTDWEQVLENNKVAFILQFVQRSRFITAFPTTLTPAQFVDTLFVNAGVTPSASERTSIINEFGGAGTSADNAARGRALRRVAENSTLNQAEKNKAFVLMQFFGYLRRNPNDPQDTDYSGYDFWLTKLNQFNGNFVNADMVQAFIDSGEYRGRFGR
jgi:hypothetical protein